MPKSKLRKTPVQSKFKPSLQESTKLLEQASKPENDDSGISHQLLSISRKIASSDSIPLNFRTKVSASSIISVFKQLHLNEIEASLYSIYLESFAWKDTEFTLDQIFLFTGLLVKFKLNPSIDKYLDQFSQVNPQVFKLFMKYKKKYLSQATSDSLQLNQKYNELTSVQPESIPMIVEYNFLVDEILKTSVSYNIEKKPKDLKKKPLKSPKSIKKSNKNKHKKVQKKYEDLNKNTLTSPSPIHMYPPDSSIFFPPMNMDRVDSLCSDFLNLSNGPSINEQFKKMSGMEYISGNRRNSDSQPGIASRRTSDPLKPMPGMISQRTSDPLKPMLNKFTGLDMLHSSGMQNDSMQSKNFFYIQ